MSYSDKLVILQSQTKTLRLNNVQQIYILCASCGKEISLMYMYRCMECHLIFCKKCEKIRNMGISYDTGFRTISSLSREFTLAVFDKLIKTAKEELDKLFTDMTHLRRWTH